MQRNILLFASGFMGELVLQKLASRAIALDIITFAPNVLRKKNNDLILKYSSLFNITAITADNYNEIALNFPRYDMALCIEWSKDFFKDCTPAFPIYYTHPSLLPFYRGYGAISEQFLKGVRISALSIYLNNAATDAGDIVFQEKININYGDTPKDFIEQCSNLIVKFIIEAISGAELKATPQNNDLGFYIARTRNRQQIIDFNASAVAVYNFITAYSYPFSGAIFYYKGSKYRADIAAIEAWQGYQGQAGTILKKSSYGIEVACGEGSVMIITQAENIVEVGERLNDV